jgi:RHS repeat-associated protein
VRKLKIFEQQANKKQIMKRVFNRTTLSICCLLIAFSTIQSGLTLFMSDTALAQAVRQKDPASVMTNGRTPQPLQSEKAEDPIKLDAVSKEVQQQAVSENSTPPLSLDPEDVDRTQEDVSKRTPNSRTYAGGTGTKVVEITGKDTAYKDEKSGELKDMQTTISDSSESKERANKRLNFWEKMAFWDQPRAYKGEGGLLSTDFPVLEANEGVKVTMNGQEMAMRPVDANNRIKPNHIQNQDGTEAVKYENVWKGVDIVYEYRGNAVKEMIVLKERPDRTRFSFDIETDAKMKQKSDGSIEVIKDDKVLFTIPAITVMVAQKGPVSDSGAHYEIEGNRLAVVIDDKWLDKQQKENYPIVIDPTVNAHESWEGISNNNYWSYKSDGYSCNSSNCYQNVGWLNDNGNKVWQSMMRIPFDQAIGKDLEYARLNVQKISNSYGWYGTEANHRYWVTWAPCFGFGCVNSAAPWIPFAITDHGWIDVTKLIQWMKDTGQTGGWLMIHGDDSPYKALNPGGSTLQLVYNRKPTKPTLSSPANETTQTTAMPKLISNAASDPDGDALTYQFEVYDGSTLISESPEQTSRSWVVPDGTLQDGGTYRWRSIVSDNRSNVASDMASFTVDLRLGNKDKTQTYDELGPVAVNLANGNAYTSVDSHSIDALGGDIGLKLDYNTPKIGKKGLTATYYNDAGGQKKVLQRTDPNVNFSWGNSSPAPGVVSKDNFSVNWSGYFIAPTTGAYKFGGSIDDKMDFNIDPEGDGTLQRLYNYGCCQTEKYSDTTVQLEAGKAYRISVNFHEYTGNATAAVWVKAPGYLGQVMPQDWVRTLDLEESAGDKQGLRAQFYKDYDKSRQFKPNQAPFLVKNYNEVNLAWGTNSIADYDGEGDYKDDVLGRFSGYITIPTTGTYKFGVGADDGKRLFINGNKVAEQWGNLNEAWSGNLTFNAGDVVPVVVEYYEATGSAAVKLKWEGAAGTGIIPATALSTSYRDLPTGWNLSLDASGAINYERLRVVSGGNIALISGDGTQHIYKASGGGYKPPTNEDGILSKNADGSYTLQDVSGQVYEFNVKGVLTSLTSPADDRKPAALRYEYQDESGVPRIKKIIDGVDDQRYGELFYGGSPECQTAAGFDATPAGFLCAFITYDGQVSRFHYKNDKLARVELPGNVITDLGNDSHGRLTSVRDPLANDAVATATRVDNEELLSQIAYDQIGRVSAVKAPAAEASGWRQEHTIGYGFGNTKRHAVGAPEPKGYSQYIEYDGLGRTTKACDLQALCSIQEWHPTKDLLFSSTDPLGQMATTTYDDEDRPTNSYGPAPKDWFNTWSWTLTSNKELVRGQYLKSADGRFTFTYQTNGNLVIRNQDNSVRWNAHTDGKASTRLRMQADGNLVLYNGSTAVWHTSTGGQGDGTAYLHMQNNGNLVIWVENIDGTKSYKWTSGTNGTTDKEFAADYNTPKAANQAQVPRSQTAYDENIVGAEITYHQLNGKSLFGAPDLRATGLYPENPGGMHRTWGSAMPITVESGMEGWGLRATGKVRIPTSGNYTFHMRHNDGLRMWLDDQLVIDDWKDGALRTSPAVTKALVPGKVYSLKVEYYSRSGQPAELDMRMSAVGVQPVVGDRDWSAELKPGYGLATSNIVYDAQLGNRTNAINYGSRPEYGLAQSATVDPGGLNLTLNTTYETPGEGYLRETSKTLPGSANSTFSNSYYADDETRDSPCTSDVEVFRQAGRLKLKTEADPDGSGSEVGISHETIYDNAGREVATRTNSDPWRCVTYDERGRTAQAVIPDINGRSGRTMVFNYAVDGNPFKSSVTDNAGTVTTEADLAGNTVSYIDIYGNVTTNDYDNFGKLVSRQSPLGNETFTYDDYDRVTEQKLDGITLAAIAYDQYGRTQRVDYPQAGQQSLSAISRDQRQQINGVTWRLGDGTEVSDQITNSQSGVITSNTVSSGSESSTWQYTYDAAQRLTQATLDSVATYAYGFDVQDASCGNLSSENPNAGKNSNRMNMTVDGQSTTYCYDQADRLIATSDPNMQTIAYDDHGNTMTLGNTTFTYDASNRNVGISEAKPDAETIEVAYTRDATDRIVSKQKEVDDAVTQSIRYGHMGNGDAPSFIQDGENNILEAYMTLAGGLMMTIKPTEAEQANKFTHSLRNLHGDVLITTDGNGVNTSTGSGPASSFQYDPFGQSLTTNPDNTQTGTFGWVGRAQKTTEVELTLAPVQMGARVYIPSLGRFLQVDPVQGGTLNNYVYAVDPINQYDLNGKFIWFIPIIVAVVSVVVAAIKAAPAIIRTVTAVANLVSKAGPAITKAAQWVSKAGSAAGKGAGAGRNATKVVPRARPDTSIVLPNSIGSSPSLQLKVELYQRQVMSWGSKLPGSRPIMTSPGKIKDPNFQWPWVKYQHTQYMSDGTRLTSHWFENSITSEIKQFKIKP